MNELKTLKDKMEEVEEKKEKTEQEWTRICENEWHPIIELKPFQKCPYCKSEACHLAIQRKKIKQNGIKP